MKFQNYNLQNCEKITKIEYFENEKNKLKNPYIKITNSSEILTIELDSFACHNIFYFYDNNDFYFDTSFQGLIKKIEKKNKLYLDASSLSKFIFVNTFFGNETFLKFFFRLSPGEKLIYFKNKKQLKITKDFSIFDNINYVYNDMSDIDKFKKKFLEIFHDNYNHQTNSILLNSGGFDSRLVACLLKKLNIKFASATYYDENSIDFKICKKVCDILEIDFNGYEFGELIKELSKKENKILDYSDYRIAYHHGHFTLSHYFKNLGESFFSGIWLEFFATGFTRKDKKLPESDLDFNNYLIDLFDKGPWSGISFKNLSHLILNKNYKNFPIENINLFLKKFNYKDKAKKMDLVHFFSHGTGRYIAMKNMVSKELDIISPGLNSDLFTEMLSVNPNLRMNRKFEFELINSINKNLSELEFVKDNHKLVYLGSNKIKKLRSVLDDFLRKRKIGLLKPHYDIYVKNFDFFNSEVTSVKYFNNMIDKNKDIFYEIFNKNYKSNILENKRKISHAHFGTMKTFLEFINTFKIENIK